MLDELSLQDMVFIQYYHAATSYAFDQNQRDDYSRALGLLIKFLETEGYTAYTYSQLFDHLIAMYNRLQNSSDALTHGLHILQLSMFKAAVGEQDIFKSVRNDPFSEYIEQLDMHDDDEQV